MSKIGRKPIATGSVQVTINGQEVEFKGKKASGTYVLPATLKIIQDGSFVKITCDDPSLANNKVWGLHRALLANKLQGADIGFEEKVVIKGLGFKAVSAGNKLDLSLGYSHKISFPLPQGVTVEIDKTGQKLSFKGVDKQLVGATVSALKALRPTECYKGTGIHKENETIILKAGKTKAK
jgi:large subunit ribosomal protein L6